MSALAMLLTATMVVSGDVTEKAHGKMEQRLDLSGEWVGQLFHSTEDDKSCQVSLIGKELRFVVGEGLYASEKFDLSDKGRGKLQVTMNVLFFDTSHEGIYRCEDDRLLICFSLIPKATAPILFRADSEHWLLKLHRVKPRK